MEVRLFEEGTVPEWTTPEWYAGREAAPHLEQWGGHRERLLVASAYAKRAIQMGHTSVVDLGAGDGGLLSTLEAPYGVWGYDLQQSNVDAAKKRGVEVLLADVINEPDAVHWGDVAVMTEMLEHLIDPHGFVRRAYESVATALVASSPYSENKDSHYEFHTWAWDVRGYVDLIEQAGWRVIATDTSTMSQTHLAVR